MSMTIWKYLIPTGAFDVAMPFGAKIIHVEKPHGGAAAFWALVYPTAPLETRRFRTYGTGDAIEEGKYLGTFEPEHGLIFHLFELAGPA